MRLIPVLDLLDSQVVRGVAGKRDEYRPIESSLTDSSQPLSVARAIRAEFGLTEFYLADLDGILHDRADVELYRELAAQGFRVHVDAGVTSLESAHSLLETGIESLIVALEINPSVSFLWELLQEFGPERLIFSCDLKQGKPLGELRESSVQVPLEICEKVQDIGIRRLIVLDLAAVGVGEGPISLELCRELRARNSNLEIITGGGIRHVSDLSQCEAAGIDGVLIASALHNGSLTREELGRWCV